MQREFAVVLMPEVYHGGAEPSHYEVLEKEAKSRHVSAICADICSVAFDRKSMLFPPQLMPRIIRSANKL